MAFQPIDEEPVKQAAQLLLSFLSDASVSVPAPLVDGIVSGKTLLRGIINGQLVVCAPADEPEQTVSKKVSKKQAA
jgi:hypothetical protein